MKVLFVSDNAKLSNPFVETLIAGLYEFNLDCTASIKEWWANVEEYDIIHFQWPEIVFYWEHIRTKDLQEMEMQLQKAKSLGIKIVITCHNLKPHLKRNQDMVALYQLIYEYCDAFVHMGNIVLNCCKVIIRKPNILLFLTIYMTIFINLIKEEMKVV